MTLFCIPPRKKKLCKYELIKSTDQWEWIRLLKGTNEFIRIVVIDVLSYLNLAAILKFLFPFPLHSSWLNTEQAMYNQIGEVLLTVPRTSPFKIFYVCSTNKYSRFSKPSVHCTVHIAHGKHICMGYRQSCRLPDSASRGVFFRLRISPRILSQIRNGW